MQPFGVRDDGGTLRVVPDGAEVHAARVLDFTCDPSHPLYYGKGPSGAIGDSTFTRQFVELAIPVGAELYVMGHARLRDDVVEPEIAASEDAELFLISVHPEERLIGRAGIKAFFQILFGAPFAFFAPAILGTPRASTFEIALRRQMPLCILAAAGYGAALAIGYLVLVYNGLAAVRQRRLMAKSLIDVQLLRRQELIPRLAATVRAYAGHESTVHGEVAALRTEALRKNSMREETEVAAGQRAALGRVLLLAERYPALLADARFRALQLELTDTEDRIALAREFYNASVTAWNSRIQTLPDLVVARLLRCRPVEYLASEGFERSAAR
jgi:hypothetical protein